MIRPPLAVYPLVHGEQAKQLKPMLITPQFYQRTTPSRSRILQRLELDTYASRSIAFSDTFSAR